jgi:hypothetical protein
LLISELPHGEIGSNYLPEVQTGSNGLPKVGVFRHQSDRQGPPGKAGFLNSAFR